MKRLSDLGLTWILCGGLFLLGLLIGMNLPAVRALRLSCEIDPANVFNGLAILAIGILIDYRYRKLTEAKRAETELLLEDVRQVKAAFKNLCDAFTPCKTSSKKLDTKQQRTLTMAASDLEKALYALEKGLTYCQVNMDKLEFEALRKAGIDLTEVVTYDPYPGPYSEPHLKRISHVFDVFNDELVRMPYRVSQR